jgi:hypothetical protein
MDKQKQYENPDPNPGEKQVDFINRCIPYIKKEHPEWEHDKVVAVCYSIWKDKGNSQENFKNFETFECDAELKFETVIVTNNNNKETSTTKKMVAIIGDRFMNGGFFPNEELKKCYDKWNGTLHDINHMGTSGDSFPPKPDIRFFVGRHTNANYNEETKAVTLDIVPANPKMPYTETWENYLELCKQAGQIPNVSVTYMAQRKFIKAKDLPNEINYKEYGYNEEDNVPYLYNVIPVCVSTVLIGKCDDKQGCGIGTNTGTASCSYQDNKQDYIDTILKEKRKEMIKYLKNRNSD